MPWAVIVGALVGAIVGTILTELIFVRSFRNRERRKIRRNFLGVEVVPTFHDWGADHPNPEMRWRWNIWPADEDGRPITEGTDPLWLANAPSKDVARMDAARWISKERIRRTYEL